MFLKSAQKFSESDGVYCTKICPPCNFLNLGTVIGSGQRSKWDLRELAEVKVHLILHSKHTVYLSML